jgi:hypothetical protein
MSLWPNDSCGELNLQALSWMIESWMKLTPIIETKNIWYVLHPNTFYKEVD